MRGMTRHRMFLRLMLTYFVGVVGGTTIGLIAAFVVGATWWGNPLMALAADVILVAIAPIALAGGAAAVWVSNGGQAEGERCE